MPRTGFSVLTAFTTRLSITSSVKTVSAPYRRARARNGRVPCFNDVACSRTAMERGRLFRTTLKTQSRFSKTRTCRWIRIPGNCYARPWTLARGCRGSWKRRCRAGERSRGNHKDRCLTKSIQQQWCCNVLAHNEGKFNLDSNWVLCNTAT